MELTKSDTAIYDHEFSTEFFIIIKIYLVHGKPTQLKASKELSQN